jgi:hypothetical protein
MYFDKFLWCRKRLISLALIFIICIAGLLGCASLMVAGVSGGVAYTMSNVAYKTVSFSLSATDVALRNALRHMDIREVARNTSDDMIEIEAVTRDLNISITLERITTKTTKISVDAKKSFVIKDRATAAEIIEQTVAILQSTKFREGEEL